MVLLGVLFSILLVFIKSRNRASTDTTISTLSSVAAALGIVLLARGGSFAKYSTFLIGDFLSISTGDLILACIVFVVVLLFWILFFNKTYLISLNPTLAHSLGVKTVSYTHLDVYKRQDQGSQSVLWKTFCSAKG